MGRWRLGLALVLGLTGLAQAATVNLICDPYVQGETPAVDFRLYRGAWLSSACQGAVLLWAQPITDTTFSDTTAQAGQTYCYFLTAVAADGKESGPSNVVSFSVPVPLPLAPRGLRAS